MRIVRFHIDQTRPGPYADCPGCRPTTAIEGRIVLNRFEVWALTAILWARVQWFEQVTYRLGRLLCRLLQRHNITCRGRADHDGRERLRWPHR